MQTNHALKRLTCLLLASSSGAIHAWLATAECQSDKFLFRLEQMGPAASSGVGQQLEVETGATTGCACKLHDINYMGNSGLSPLISLVFTIILSKKTSSWELGCINQPPRQEVKCLSKRKPGIQLVSVINVARVLPARSHLPGVGLGSRQDQLEWFKLRPVRHQRLLKQLWKEGSNCGDGRHFPPPNVSILGAPWW